MPWIVLRAGNTSEWDRFFRSMVCSQLTVISSVFLKNYLFLIFLIFIYLDALGLSWGTRDLLVLACGIYFLDQESNPGPLHWEHGILTIGPPGKSSSFLLIAFCYPIG